MAYTEKAVIKAMKVQEILAKAMSGELKWYQAAAILKVSPRQLRRHRERWEKVGSTGLFDGRMRQPSPKKAGPEDVALVVKLYREEYFDFSVAHFHEKMRTEHGLKRGYTWTKRVLQEAGLVVRGRRRSAHRKRRPRRPMAGMMLHLDASTHAWLGPEHGQQDLLCVLDDATNEIYRLLLVPQESTLTCMRVLREVIGKQGLFSELYTDRASHFTYTPKAGEGPSKTVKTQLGRALDQCNVLLILGRSPEARGRSERMWRTLQGRLPQEIRRAGATTYEAAQRFIDDCFLPAFVAQFRREPTVADSAFVPTVGIDLDRVFSEQHERVVGKDNVVQYDNLALQIEPSRLRSTFARCKVTVCESPSRVLSVWYGLHFLGCYNREGALIEAGCASAPYHTARTA